MTAGLISFFGVIIGAVLQYLFTRHIEGQRHIRDLRSTAYMDYLQCVCEHAQLVKIKNEKEIQELFAKTADAKARICLYGSSQAISAFSTFEKLGSSMNTDQQQRAFTDMVSIMRTDSGSKLVAESKDLQIILLGYRE